MLSYQHGYHAGNLADVHKHALLSVALDYLTRKDKPLTYIETHAGRGLYRLDAPEAVKTGEAVAGIARVEGLGWFATDHPYARHLSRIRATYGAAAYPGSPVIAAEALRAGDKLHLAELHPQEQAGLAAVMAPYAARVVAEDGLTMALAITPPEPRRGLILIDPSYEVKEDYARLPPLIAKLHRKWNVGAVMLWYPILSSGAHRPMLRALEAEAFPGALRHEVSFGPVREGHRMGGSGIFWVNAPWGVESESERLSALFAAL